MEGLMSLAHSGHQSAPILRQPVPSCGAKGQSKRHREGFVCPQPLVPLWFGKPDPALLSTPTLGLKLAHKFFGCLAPASNRQFKPDVSSCRSHPPTPQHRLCKSLPKRSRGRTQPHQSAAHTPGPQLGGGRGEVGLSLCVLSPKTGAPL
jgi:hypothetical protein